VIPRKLLITLIASSALLASCQLLDSSKSEMASTATAVKRGATPDLIPRDTFFGNPDRVNPDLSPDGTHLAFVAPVGGVLNLWVGSPEAPGKAKALTHDTGRGITNYSWTHTNKHIVYLQDLNGDENWRLHSINVDTGKTLDLTPQEGVQARIQQTSPDFPTEILVGLNDRDPAHHDLWRVNFVTGEKTLFFQNDDGYAGFTTDDDFTLRLAVRFTPDGGNEIFERKSDAWSSIAKIGAEDSLTTSPAGFDKTGKVLYMIDSRGRDTAALMAWDLTTGKSRIVHADPRSDVGGVLAHPTDKTILAVANNYEKRTWKVLDPVTEKDFAFLRSKASGAEFSVVSQTQDNAHWVVAFYSDTSPTRYYHFDRTRSDLDFLFTNQTDLENLPLASMHPVKIRARDGLELVSYLTLPPGSHAKGSMKPDSPVPMVLFVHGGPWARDSWGYHPYHQWLANRGYAVLSVNYRGSTGFGKGFLNAGNFEWAAKMHDDLIDAVSWSIKQGIADEKKVGIMGGSYGGYATLVGLTFTPDTFACGVDIVGPSNLVTLLETIPPYWGPILEVFTKRVGDHRTDDGRALLASRSPLTRVDRIKKPLLIGQGANDPRVKQSEADQIVAAMQKKHIPVTYVLYPDEGHGFRRPQNSGSFNAVAEAFLAQHLGGRFEPVGDDFEGSTLQIVTGADQIPGIASAAKMIPAN
jgi:dipeptidyl aminopeptidase/acylaminoacyl peptidase